MKKLWIFPLFAFLLLATAQPGYARRVDGGCRAGGLEEAGYTQQQINDFARGCQDFLDNMIAATGQPDHYYEGYWYAHSWQQLLQTNDPTTTI